MSDPAGTIHGASEGGVAGSYPDRAPLRVLASPADADQFNTLRAAIFPLACFKLEDIRFDFGSSMVLPELKKEMPLLAALITKHTEAEPKKRLPPVSIFGHADPTGDDEFNKALSGRRAAAIYGLLTRRTEVWEDLYSNGHKFASGAAGDDWGTRAVQTMLNALPANAFAAADRATTLPDGSTPPPLEVTGKLDAPTQAAVKRFQGGPLGKADGLAVDGDPGKNTRKTLFMAYMNELCVDESGKPYQLDATTGFLARNADAGGKGDFQGCGEFNPALLFSNDDKKHYDADKDKSDRNNANAPNRRVMVLLFRPGAKVDKGYWPCPRAKESSGDCRKRFWSDGQKRRTNTDEQREFKDTQDTFACRFYQRLVSGSPCDTLPPPVVARCRMVKAGGTMDIIATDIPGVRGGDYKWTTTSGNIKLTNADTATVTVEGLTPSGALGAEIITLTAGPITKTVPVTVVKILFSASANQRYGYDDFDTPNTMAGPPAAGAKPFTEDDHVCVKSSDFTFVKVEIKGGAVGTDFDFACDDPDVCKADAAPATATFDLRLNAGATKKGHTPLRVKVKCPKGDREFGQIEVNVYKERAVNVVVGKIDNPNHSFLRFPLADYAAHATAANEKLKEGVVKYNITNYNADNSAIKVSFVSGDGTLSYDIGKGGGKDLEAIRAAMTGVAANAVRVAIIRDMKSYYYLKNAVAKHATTLTLTASAGAVFYHGGESVLLGTGGNQETVKIVSVSGSTITCDPLSNAHAANEPMEFPAAGWSSDPILIKEGSSALDVAKWTVLHEVGHRDLGLQLLDIIDKDDFMNFSQDWTDHRLRYCPRLQRYPDGTTDKENQWERIPRD